MCAKVKLKINGVEIEAEESRKLMDILRNDCKLKSVKDGCSEGVCGTCTVLIDGKPVKACVQPAKKFEERDILTVEGLSDREKEVYTYAFNEAGAVQCGFCIPGMVLCAKSLLDINPKPDRAQIAYAIRNNICRCTGYKKIMDAIELAAVMLREDIKVPELRQDGISVGQFLQRVDGRKKILGMAQFCDDIDLPGMIFASAVRSEYPRARVLKIDTSEAEKLPGVVCVLTYKDVPEKGSNKVGHLKQDWNTFIREGGITHYLGDTIAIVAAENNETLEQAKKLVKVEYEVLKPVTCPAEALKEGAVLVHKDGNILSHEHLVRGNADEVIEASKYKVTNHYELPWTEHAFLEPECSVAMPLEDGVLVFSSDQSVYDTRREISLLLGLEPSKIIVENKYVGGGFGGKEDVTVQHHAALVAFITKRIVKCKLSRQESILVHPKRHPMSIDMTTACDEKGRLTAMKAVVVADTGAYASLGGPVLQRACTHAAGPYNYQVIDIDGKAVYTNNPPAGAFRGFGVTQTCFATEMNINKLAELVGMDPWEFRMKNAIRPGQVLPNGQIADSSTGLVETLMAVKDEFYSPENKYVGIACAMKNAGVGVGLPDTGRCRLVIDGGKVHIRTGATCMGQGLATVLTHIICAELGIGPAKVQWHNPNTSTSPDSGTTSGSRQTLITGEACRRACEKIKEDMELIPDNDLSKLNGREYYGEWRTKTDLMGSDKPNPVSHVAYGYATQMCILNDDGTVKKIVAAHEVGKAINPRAVEGQIEGGVVMSLGYALTEKYPIENCVPKAKFGTLGLFRADKTPDVEAIVVEKSGIKEAHGAIGVGEITSIPTAPAVAGAYYKYNGEFQTSLPLKGTPYERKQIFHK